MRCSVGPTTSTPLFAASRWARSSRAGSGGGADVVSQAGPEDMADQIAALRSALERVKAGGLSKDEEAVAENGSPSAAGRTGAASPWGGRPS